MTFHRKCSFWFLLIVGLSAMGGLLTTTLFRMKDSGSPVSRRSSMSQMRQGTKANRLDHSSAPNPQVHREAEPARSLRRPGSPSRRDAFAVQTGQDNVDENPQHSGQLEAGTARKPYVVPLIYRLDDEDFLSQFPQMTPQVVESLKAEFELKLGVDELSPDDPTYVARWEHAEMSLRDRIRVLYGWAAWGEYERQTLINAGAVEDR